jgi:t-SNARE complex subunit (syntaxin)
MARGEKIEDLESRSEELDASAAQFQRNAKKARWTFAWRNIRNLLIIFFILAVILVLVLWVAGVFNSDD